MRIIFVFFILFSIQLSAQSDSSQYNEDYSADTVKKTSGQQRFMSAGILGKVNDTLLADLSEITVGDWLFYSYSTDLSKFPYISTWGKISEEEKQYLWSTLPNVHTLPSIAFVESLPYINIFRKCTTCDVLSKYGLDVNYRIPVEADSLKTPESKSRLLATLNLPIAGITYNQVLAFCTWRTKLDSLRFGRNYNFRLPTPSEFDLINPFQDSISTGKHARPLFNYKNASYPNTKGWRDVSRSCGKEPVDSYIFCRHIKNKNTHQFFFNVQGNVAEMTSVKGVARGGSYFHFAKEGFAGVTNYYTQPDEVWLGFRCVAERKK